jgi:hypothetical protein
MDSQFQDLIDRLDLLSDQFNDLRGLIRKAIRLADDDPEMALTRVRKVLEYVVHDAYQRLVKESPGTRPLENLLQLLVKGGHLPPHLAPYTTFIRELGNAGTHHPDGNYKKLDVNVSLIQLRAVLDWYFQMVRPDAEAPSVKTLIGHDVEAERAPQRAETQTPFPIPDTRVEVGGSSPVADGAVGRLNGRMRRAGLAGLAVVVAGLAAVIVIPRLGPSR